MRRLFIFLLFLIASVWFGLTVFRHPGYMFISYQHWVVQMPLWFSALSLFLLLGVFYFVITSIDALQFMAYRFKKWLQIRRERRAFNRTQRGLSLLIEARWKKAEDLLMAGINTTVDPLMNYLGAARAAQEQNAFDRRDEYIQKAYQAAPKSDLIIGLTKAELEFSHNEIENSLETLRHLRDIAPRNPQVLKMLEKIYVRLGDWTSLRILLPSLRKAKVLTSEQAYLLEKNIYCEILREATHRNLEGMRELWKEIPRAFRRNPDVVYEYVHQMVKFKDISEVEDLIRKTLKYTWNASLVKIYGSLDFSNLNKQLVIVGGWLKTYGQKPEILLTLGKLCARIQLWGKAKDYFEKCLALGPNPEASLEYAKLLEELGDEEEAVQKYRDGLGSMVA